MLQLNSDTLAKKMYRTHSQNSAFNIWSYYYETELLGHKRWSNEHVCL